MHLDCGGIHLDKLLPPALSLERLQLARTKHLDIYKRRSPTMKPLNRFIALTAFAALLTYAQDISRASLQNIPPARSNATARWWPLA
jgi:hypothetical protein